MSDGKTAEAGKIPAQVKPRRYMHTMLRVFDLDKSIDFYTRLLGMKLIRKKDFENGRFTLAFLGYGEEDDTTVLELTYNWDQVAPYDIGTAYGHIALAAPKIDETCEELEREGVKIPRPPGPNLALTGCQVVGWRELLPNASLKFKQRCQKRTSKDSVS